MAPGGDTAAISRVQPFLEAHGRLLPLLDTPDKVLGNSGALGRDTHTQTAALSPLLRSTGSRISELSTWLVCEGWSHPGGVMYVHVDRRPPARLWVCLLPPQASSFKLMGNFTLFGMVEVMCEVNCVPTQAPTPCTQVPVLCIPCSCNTCAAQAHPAAAGCTSQPQAR